MDQNRHSDNKEDSEVSTSDQSYEQSVEDNEENKSDHQPHSTSSLSAHSTPHSTHPSPHPNIAIPPHLKKGRMRNESGGSNPSESEKNEDVTTTPDGKRQKPLSQHSKSPIAMALFPNEIPASPPRFVSLEEIMKAANGVENLVLAHEIAVDQNFKLEKVTPPRNSLEGQVKEVLHRAFWDVLESQLNESPTNFDQAMVLLEEIRGNLLSLLLPQHTRLKQEIEEILDLNLILQQAENGILDFQRYAQYILSVQSRLCAPVRDEKIKELTQTNEVIPLFRGIMDLLDMMKLDMANFHIQQMRPAIQQKSAEYERQKFQDFLDTQKKHSGVDGLMYTKAWLRRNYESLDLSSETNGQIIWNKVLNTAYIELLTMNENDIKFQDTFPETLLIDLNRFKSMRQEVLKCSIVGSILLITQATVGSSVQDLQEFKETLKTHLMLILNDVSHGSKEEEQDEDLKAAAIQVIEDVNKCLSKHSFGTLDDAKKSSLESQILELKKNDNRVKKVIERRIVEFLECILSSPTAVPMQIPAGLSMCQNELTTLAGQLMRIVSHNKAVFKDYYSDIISKLTSPVSSSSLESK